MVELGPTEVIIKGKVYDCAKDYYKLEDLMPFEFVIKGDSVEKPAKRESKVKQVAGLVKKAV